MSRDLLQRGLSNRSRNDNSDINCVNNVLTFLKDMLCCVDWKITKTCICVYCVVVGNKCVYVSGYF